MFSYLNSCKILPQTTNFLLRRGGPKCIRPSSIISRHQPRPFIRKMSSHLPAVKPLLSTALPSDSYQLLPTSEKTGAAEDALFTQEVEDVKQWWASPRYEGIQRPYSAEDIVSKRGTLQQTYPSSLMARKLFNLLKERAAAGEPVHTSEESCEEETSSRQGLTNRQWGPLTPFK